MVARPLAALVALVLAGCATAGAVRFPNATPRAPRSIPATEVRPPGDGPFPAVVLLHGCAGVTESTRQWAHWFRDRGYVALVVDSWGPRGLPEGTCSGSAPEIPNTERLDDTVGALRWLHTRPYVARDRIGVIGWSNGGVFAMAAINGPSLERAARRGVAVPEPGFRAAVALYPGGCFSLVAERVVRPLLVLIGEADDWTPARECDAMITAMRGRGADATLVVYPGAYHYFDVEGQVKTYLADAANHTLPGGCCGATVAYDAAAATDARRRIDEFFGYHLRP